jgi:hypothetical protein
MSCEMALCYRVLKTKDIAPVLDFGITIDDFISHEAKALWATIIGYYNHPQSAGSVLDPYVLRIDNKNFAVGDDMSGHSIQSLCTEVRKYRVKAESNQAIVDFTQAMAFHEIDPMGPLAVLNGHVTRLQALGTRANTDVSLLQGIQGIKQRILLAKSGVDFSKMSWPWQPLQDETFGVQPDDYVVFYGRPKSMKTWVLAYLIYWAFAQERRVLVYTKEMTPDNVYMRTVACILKIAYAELRGAVMSQYKPMSPAEEMALDATIAYIQSDPSVSNLVTVLSGRDVGAGMDTVPWLASKVDKYKPAILFVDGLYLLSDHQKHNSDHQRVMHISRDLRDLVLGLKTPVIATMQANRKAAGHREANLDELAYSDALGQDATIAARVINDKNSPTISVIIGGSREFNLHGFRIHGVPAKSFDFHSVLTEQDIKKATEDDHGEEEAKEPKKAKKAKKKGEGPQNTEDADFEHHANKIGEYAAA